MRRQARQVRHEAKRRAPPRSVSLCAEGGHRMSMQLFNEVSQLKLQLEEIRAAGLASRADGAQLPKLIEAQAAEIRELRLTVKKLEARILTFDALKEAIAKDAREILHAKRDLIDPTKV